MHQIHRPLGAYRIYVIRLFGCPPLFVIFDFHFLKFEGIEPDEYIYKNHKTANRIFLNLDGDLPITLVKPLEK